MTELNLDSNSNITEIENYEKEMNTGYWLSRYHAEWCGHCIQMSDEWKNFLKQKKKVSVKIASIEESAFNKLKNQPTSFRGFPTIMLTKNGKFVSEFNGNRTAENFQNFINENCPKISLKSTLKKNKKHKKPEKQQKQRKNRSLSQKKN